MVTTFPLILQARLGKAAAEPFVTFYDVGTGERTELSVTTYANWVAKTSSLLLEEYDVERGSRVRIDLPAHWLGPVLLGAVWNLGATALLADAPADSSDLVVTGPDGLARHSGTGIPVLATALHPLGRPFEEPLPGGVDDFGTSVWSQPDAFTPYDPPQGDDLAVEGSTQAQMWSAAAAGSLLTSGGRLFTEANPASPSGLASFTQPLVLSGSVVLVAGDPDPGWIDSMCDTERVTDRSR